MTRVVVITGASAGVGRATARAFAAQGASVGLLARGRAGLEAAAAEVREAGGRALVVPLDVSDAEAVDRAADEVERTFGPIDVWVNVAMAAVLAEVADTTADEFRRVTEVTYLGSVHGTQAALRRMLPRDRGSIVQVGSALGRRGIPLQATYCGAKHAIQGFVESLRTELLHRGSKVRLTIVQLPGMNTTQFSWVRARTAQPARSRCRPSTSRRSPRARSCGQPTTTGASSGSGSRPCGRSWATGSRPGSSTATSPGPPSTRSRPPSRWIPDRADYLFAPLDDERDHGTRGSFDDQAHAAQPAGGAEPSSPQRAGRRGRRARGGRGRRGRRREGLSGRDQRGRRSRADHRRAPRVAIHRRKADHGQAGPCRWRRRHGSPGRSSSAWTSSRAPSSRTHRTAGG